MSWRRLNGTLIDEDIVAKVENTLMYEHSLGNRMKLCIGTDSQKKGDVTEFATVIVFVREKKGGFMYINPSKEFREIGLKERMILEVGKSVEIAYALCPMLEKYDVALEVHADINTDPQFPSNVALKEAMGYILSMGFEFRAKPHAFASTSCADKVV